MDDTIKAVEEWKILGYLPDATISVWQRGKKILFEVRIDGGDDFLDKAMNLDEARLRGWLNHLETVDD